MNQEDKYIKDRHKQIDRFEELMQEKLNRFEEFQKFDFYDDLESEPSLIGNIFFVVFIIIIIYLFLM